MSRFFDFGQSIGTLALASVILMNIPREEIN